MKRKIISYEDQICPNREQLMVNEKYKIITAQILDNELDIVECTFNYGDCVEINTEGLTHISLSRQNLKTLIKLIKDSEEMYSEMPESFLT